VRRIGRTRNWVEKYLAGEWSRGGIGSMEYKQYIISEFVNDKGQWQAKIRRQDGKPMLIDGAKVDVFHTPHADSEIEAVRIAKEAIDTKKVSVVRD
jgi:hypothetical protein